jgi:hypothetical protein
MGKSWLMAFALTLVQPEPIFQAEPVFPPSGLAQTPVALDIITLMGLIGVSVFLQPVTPDTI